MVYHKLRVESKKLREIYLHKYQLIHGRAVNTSYVAQGRDVVTMA